MEKWITTWAQAHANMSVLCGKAKNATVRATVTSEISGTAIRLHLANYEGKKAVRILQTAVGTQGVTFSGKRELTLNPGEWVYSDPVPCKVKKGDPIRISMAFAGKAASGNQLPVNVCYSQKGNYALEADMPQAKQTWQEKKYGLLPVLPILSGVEVLTEEAPEVLVCFGDSITQQSHWTTPLDAMLPNTVVINKGIGGNRLLSDPMSQFMALWGPAAVKRFRRDVLEESGATGVVFALGTNDIGMARKQKELALCNAEILFGTLCDLASQAKQKGLKTYIATVTPRGNSTGYQDWHEAERLKLNRLIRESTVFDGIFDFDAATRDTQKPDIFDEKCDSGDHLHPGPEGGRRMAEEACRILTK